MKKPYKRLTETEFLEKKMLFKENGKKRGIPLQYTDEDIQNYLDSECHKENSEIYAKYFVLDNDGATYEDGIKEYELNTYKHMYYQAKRPDDVQELSYKTESKTIKNKEIKENQEKIMLIDEITENINCLAANIKELLTRYAMRIKIKK